MGCIMSNRSSIYMPRFFLFSVFQQMDTERCGRPEKKEEISPGWRDELKKMRVRQVEIVQDSKKHSLMLQWFLPKKYVQMCLMYPDTIQQYSLFYSFFINYVSSFV